jgi:hypothetical protein
MTIILPDDVIDPLYELLQNEMIKDEEAAADLTPLHPGDHTDCIKASVLESAAWKRKIIQLIEAAS